VSFYSVGYPTYADIIKLIYFGSPSYLTMQELFRRFAVKVSRMLGSVWTFLIFIILLMSTGIYFDFSEKWENNISFVVAVITLSALFFLQKSQNHNDNAIQLKLDELIKATSDARDEVAAAEQETEKDLEKLKMD